MDIPDEPPQTRAERITLTFNQTVRGITEFIEVAIHTILYVRQIYPADLFVRRKKYETPVWQSRHPALNQYISGAVKAIADELVLGNVEKVIVVIKDKEEIALERFVFVVDNMIKVELYDKDIPVEGAMTPAALTQYFRSFLIKLGLVESQLGQMHLGDEATFAILLELRDGTKPSGKAEKWMPAMRTHTTAAQPEDAEFHLLRAVDTGVINLSLAVQEHPKKFEREELTKY